jgi:methionine--tRNA ligase beta chain
MMISRHILHSSSIKLNFLNNRIFSNTCCSINQNKDKIIEELTTDLSKLEIRVGKIIEIAKHTGADYMYVEKVDIGENIPRTVVSGLVNHCSTEELLNQEVIVLCNLKSRTIKGIQSSGMLLCSSNAESTKPIIPPAGLELGSLIRFKGHKCEFSGISGNRANKSFTKIYKDLYVNDSGIATYKGIEFMTPKGPVTSSIIGPIS